MYVAQPFLVSGESMDKTFADGNYLIIDEISYRFEKPQRGDVIVFRVPEGALELSNYKLSGKTYFIKRIVGLPGETIEVKDNQVKIYSETNKEGIILNEPYVFVDKLSPARKVNIKKTLGIDEYFVMGDNRNNSSDSRFWGPIKKDEIRGRALIRLFPFTKIGIFPGEYSAY